ncbi:MAG: alpha/beta family hydrolase [Candidatus Marinimicrobia bacterium]|nr:alpha/beta family hydrolase [Candidatus Neomarinimicrobiota bacterium]
MKHIENIVYPYNNAEILVDYRLPDTPSDVTLLLGHGRYNDMNQPLLKYLSEALPKENVNLVRFNYPFAQEKQRFVSHSKCRKAYRAALEDVREELPGMKFFFAGGKSLSAMIAAQAVPEDAAGYVLLTWPLHTPRLRIPFSRKALFALKKPMMFVSGTQDPFCDRGKLELLVGALNPHARMMLVPDANHSLELQDETKRTQEDVYKEIADILLWFMSDVIEKRTKSN